MKRAGTGVPAAAALGGLLLLLGACTPAPAPASGNTQEATMFRVSFATDAASLDGEGEASISGAARYLLAHPAAHATLIGRADSAGPMASNQALSQHRAETVRDALVMKRHIAPERLETQWTGELREALAVGLDNPSAANRVVDIVIR